MRAPTHFLYADDVLLFFWASLRDLRAILDAFHLYGSLSGQHVNRGKSSIYFGSGVSRSRIYLFLSTSGTCRGGDSMTYLGVPLFMGAPRSRWLLPLADKIKNKLQSWMELSLSMAGSLCLINSVIYDSFLHSFQVYRWPASILKSLNSAIHNFFWSGSIDIRKAIQVAWSACCRPKEEGVLGIRDFRILNRLYVKRAHLEDDY